MGQNLVNIVLDLDLERQRRQAGKEGDSGHWRTEIMRRDNSSLVDRRQGRRGVGGRNNR